MIGQLRAMRAGDLKAAPFDGTAADFQNALNYLNAPGGILTIAPGLYTWAGNFTMYGKTTIRGYGAQNTIIQRTSGDSGIFLREKTAGEGNSVGATGIWLENLGIFANGSAGDGLNFGNQGGATFTSNASLQHVLVRDFLSGSGAIVNANSVTFADLWMVNCVNGMVLQGGSSEIFGGRFEGCSAIGLDLASPWNKVYALHLETSGALPSTALLYVESSRNFISGIDILLDRNCTNNLIREKTGASNVREQHVIVNGAFTWTNTIYNETWSGGSGALDFIPDWIDGGNARSTFFYDKTNNQLSSVVGSVPIPSAFALTDAATIAVDASKASDYTVTLAGNRTMGAPTNPTTNQHITFEIIQDGTGGRTLAWNAAFKTNWSDAGNTLGKRSTISFRYNGTNWMQLGAQSAYL